MSALGHIRGSLRRVIPAVLTVLLPAALLATGCAGSSSTTAPAPKFEHDAPTLLAAGTGNFEGSPSFRLTMKLNTPKDDKKPAYGLNMNGVWDVRQNAGQMDGILRGAHATVVSVGGTEYVSLPPATKKRTGRNWLRGANGVQTFSDFPDVHKVAMILRTAEQPKLVESGGGKWHVAGTLDRATTLRKVPNPLLKDFIGKLPKTTNFDLWTNDAGQPQRIVLTMNGDPKKFRGTVEFSDFGAKPTVQTPTTDQILSSLPPKK